jgi:hypothetical protein
MTSLSAGIIIPESERAAIAASTGLVLTAYPEVQSPNGRRTISPRRVDDAGTGMVGEDVQHYNFSMALVSGYDMYRPDLLIENEEGKLVFLPYPDAVVFDFRKQEDFDLATQTFAGDPWIDMSLGY